MKRFASISIFTLAAMLAMAAPKRLANFNEVFQALQAGHEVRVVADYAKCTLIIDGKEEPAPAAIGGTVLNHWEYFARGVVRNEKAYIASSDTVLIAHPRHGHVFNYVRFRIYEDNAVEITARYLKVGSYEVVMDETFKGAISNGKDKAGISFFLAKP